MELSAEKLKEILTWPGHVSEADFESARGEAERDAKILEHVLVERGMISDENLGKAVANALGRQFIDLTKTKIDGEALRLVPEVAARAQRAIVFERSPRGLKLATSNPDNFEFFKLLEKKTGEQITVYYATPLGIEEALRHYKSDLEHQVKTLVQGLEKDGGNEEDIVKLVNVLLEYGYDNRASDIHIGPLKDSVSIRFRIDGVLHEIATYPKNLHDKVVFRIKIMARLRTDEHAAAQDGRFSYEKENTQFDVRVSVLPVTEGENVVLRILAEGFRRLYLEDLGLLDYDLEKVKRAAGKPYGMILAAGPTGSGKTTTLYAILQTLNKPEVNIMTIEDPVEYDIEHVQQTQVNPKKNLTFATGLRSIVRQDPDIIMVGEVRDNETAGIAVNAAMTGHLVLSTMHANDSSTAFPRLIDMGVEPFLVASGINVVVAQRLVRKICVTCRKSVALDKRQLKLVESDPVLLGAIREISGKENLSDIRIYKGAGCRMCGDTGYSGRTGIFEVLEISDEIRSLITQKASSDIIHKKAREEGMKTMLYDGVQKMFLGVTTLEEILRATKT